MKLKHNSNDADVIPTHTSSDSETSELSDREYDEYVERRIWEAQEKSDDLLFTEPDPNDDSLHYRILIDVAYGATNISLNRAIKEAKALRKILYDSGMLVLGASMESKAIDQLEQDAKLRWEGKMSYGKIASRERKLIMDTLDEILKDGKLRKGMMFRNNSESSKKILIARRILLILGKWGYSIRESQALITEAIDRKLDGWPYFTDKEPVDEMRVRNRLKDLGLEKGNLKIKLRRDPLIRYPKMYPK